LRLRIYGRGINPNINVSPNAKLDFVYSTTAGKLLSVAHHDLMGDIEMNFTDTVNPNVNVVFLCLGHGKSIQFLEQNQFASHTKIIDLEMISD
jgi:N-acetyl-gamma-glutamyl-phosphate reductase